MAMRILSGMVFIPNGGTRSGTVDISFEPFALTGASNPVFELRKKCEAGPRGRFKKKPAFVVGARQFGILTIVGDGGYYRMNIDDLVTRDSIRIRWKARGGRLDQEEIGFMVIGEVPDPPAKVTLPPRSVTTEVNPSGRRPRR